MKQLNIHQFSLHLFEKELYFHQFKLDIREFKPEIHEFKLHIQQNGTNIVQFQLNYASHGTKSFTKSLKLELKINNYRTNLLEIVTIGLEFQSDMQKRKCFPIQK